MISGGLKFSDAAPMLSGVVENGIDPNDPRVMARTNEATKIIMDYLICVGGMATFDVTAVGTILLLPKELENGIEFEVLGKAKVRGQTDVTQGFYSLVANATYVDPSLAMDNPTVDQGLVPDPVDPSILRRQYNYPGLDVNSVVRVTGAKRFLPITQNNDYLIVQNIEAIKLVILSLERNENNAQQEGVGYRQQALELLQAEVKKHLLDPGNYMKRKAAYEDDIVTFPINTFGWMRARIALEVPAAMQRGKSQLTRILEMAEMRLMEKGMWRGTMKQYEADVVGGCVYFPKDVFSVLAMDVCGHPIDIRSQFHEYLENGPGKHSHCEANLVDLGEEYFPGSGNTRRKYKLHAGAVETSHISAICKIRWIAKVPTDPMVIQNFEAMRLMATAIINERDEKWQEAMTCQQQAVQVLNDELTDYLRGIKHTPQVQDFGFGMSGVGRMH